MTLFRLLCSLSIILTCTTVSVNAWSETAPAYTITPLAEGLDQPWSIAKLDNGDYLVTEKPGRLVRLKPSGHIENITGVPAVYFASQGGLLDVVLHPNHADNGWIYLSYAAGEPKDNRTHIARAQLSGYSLTDLEEILSVTDSKATAAHYGGKLAFLPDGTLIVGIGEGFSYREKAQQLGSELGKVLRINDDGSVPTDNPYPEVAPRVLSYGHRNPQGLVVLPSGQILMHEHGPKGGDEINAIVSGKNYGWPAITYGLDYSGAVISPFTEAPGMEQPLKYWVPSIGPSGLAVYQGDEFPEWQGQLLLGSLIDHDVRKLVLENNQIVSEQRLFEELDQRIRDVRVFDDGAIMLLTDSGQVLRVTRQH